MSDKRTFWCNSHGREATHRDKDGPCCDPKLGGILLPCMAIDITDLIEIERTKGKRGVINGKDYYA